MKVHPILSQIKRGKLGMDTIFIAFAICGGLLLPAYFYKSMKEHREKIINSRPVTP